MSLTEFADTRARHLENIEFPPLWSGDTLKSDANFIKWFQDTRPKLEEASRRSIEDAWGNLLWYTGEYLPLQNLRLRTPDGRDIEIPRQLSPFVINYLGYLTDKRAADLSIYKPNHEVKPQHDTEADRMRSRTIKSALKYIKQQVGIAKLFDQAEKWNMVFGNIYIGVDWNPNIGDLLPEEERKKVEKEKRPLVEGDLEVKLIDPWHILLWPARHYDKVSCAVQIVEIIHIEEARKKYKMPSLGMEKEAGDGSVFSFTSPWVESVRPNEVVIYRTIYKPDDYLPEGAVITHTRDTVISKELKNYPWSHKQFPWVRYTDIDVPGRLFPISFYRHLKPMQHTFNNVSGMIKKYVATTCHPKWVMVRGACNIKSLGNAATVIQHKAGMPPNLAQIKPMGPDIFNFRNTIKDEMTLLSNSHQISLGELPPNTRSGIMISRLQEIENKQRGPQIDKRNDFMGETLMLIASVMGDHYPLQSDERIMRVVGKDLLDEMKGLKDIRIYAGYNVEIQNPSGFSSELSGRLEEVSFIKKEIDPTLLSPQQTLDIIGGGLESKYYDAVTAALKSAQAENEKMSDGTNVPEPEVYEDHITHWNEHMLDVQSSGFKRLARKIQKYKTDHIMGHEELMVKLGDNNQVYLQKLSMLDGFPRFYKPLPPPEPEMPPQQPAMPVAPPMPPQAPPPGVPPEMLAAMMQKKGPTRKNIQIAPPGPDGSRNITMDEHPLG